MDNVFPERGDALRDKIVAIALKETGLSNMQRYGVFRGIFETLYRLLDDAYAHIDTLSEQASIDKATGAYLTQWGLLCGVARKRATKTQGVGTAKTYESGVLRAGMWISITGSALRFRVLHNTPFQEGGVSVLIEAEFPGSLYNVSAGAPASFTTQAVGVTSISLGPNWITSSGTSEEMDEDFRERIRDRWRSLGEGTAPSKYEYIAATIDGVSEAKLIRTPRGHGSADLIIATTTGIPDVSLLSTVRDALSQRRMICRDFLVKAPVAVHCSIDVEYRGSVSEITVHDAIAAYVLSIPIGGTLQIRNLYTRPVQGFSLSSFEILTPDRDIGTNIYEKLIPQITVRRLV